MTECQHQDSGDGSSVSLCLFLHIFYVLACATMGLIKFRLNCWKKTGLYVVSVTSDQDTHNAASPASRDDKIWW
jgi:hypothetical protein